MIIMGNNDCQFNTETNGCVIYEGMGFTGFCDYVPRSCCPDFKQKANAMEIVNRIVSELRECGHDFTPKERVVLVDKVREACNYISNTYEMER